MPIADSLAIANFASTLFMVGLIWVVQIVHYPLFSQVGRDNSVSYQRQHQTRMTWVVGPPMLVEAFTAVLLAWYPPLGVSPNLILWGIALVFMIWISTAAIQIPCHGKLAQGFDSRVHRWLVVSNWIRTVGWSMRGIVVVLILNSMLSGQRV